MRYIFRDNDFNFLSFRRTNFLKFPKNELLLVSDDLLSNCIFLLQSRRHTAGKKFHQTLALNEVLKLMNLSEGIKFDPLYSSEKSSTHPQPR